MMSFHPEHSANAELSYHPCHSGSRSRKGSVSDPSIGGLTAPSATSRRQSQDSLPGVLAIPSEALPHWHHVPQRARPALYRKGMMSSHTSSSAEAEIMCHPSPGRRARGSWIVPFEPVHAWLEKVDLVRSSLEELGGNQDLVSAIGTTRATVISACTKRSWRPTEVGVAEASRRLSLSERSILNRIHTGEIIATKRQGCWIILEWDLLDHTLRLESPGTSSRPSTRCGHPRLQNRFVPRAALEQAIRATCEDAARLRVMGLKNAATVIGGLADDLEASLDETLTGIEWVSVHEAATLKGKSTQTVRRWLASGRLVGRKIGSVWRVAVRGSLPMEAVPMATVAGGT